jgi:hypothetical protein
MTKMARKMHVLTVVVGGGGVWWLGGGESKRESPMNRKRQKVVLPSMKLDIVPVHDETSRGGEDITRERE